MTTTNALGKLNARDNYADKQALIRLLIERELANPYDVRNRGYDCNFDENLDDEELESDAVEQYTEELLREMIFEIDEHGTLELTS